MSEEQNKIIKIGDAFWYESGVHPISVPISSDLRYPMGGDFCVVVSANPPKHSFQECECLIIEERGEYLRGFPVGNFFASLRRKDILINNSSRAALGNTPIPIWVKRESDGFSLFASEHAVNSLTDDFNSRNKKVHKEDEVIPQQEEGLNLF